MKRLSFLVLLCALCFAGCAHSPDVAPSTHLSVLSGADSMPASSPARGGLLNFADAASENVPQKAKTDQQTGETPASSGDQVNPDEVAGGEEEAVSIADPLEPFNRAMFEFNDKLYFWVVKPVAQGYSEVVPEQGRTGVRNFFSNLGFPKRFVSCLLQADIGGAATELGRFVVNTLWGIGGLLDPAANEEIDLQRQNKDLGQTLGTYGLGHGFYIVWPVIGPSSLRDSIDIGGEYFLYPVSYVTPWYAWFPVRSLQEVNAASLRIGDYEALKDAAVDPYVAFRDAYIQYRRQVVGKGKGEKEKPAPGGVRLGWMR